MDKIKTKDRILLAALDLFSENGYDQTSIDLIAETVGIRGPSIYTHYKGKEEILDSLIALMEEKYNENFGNIANLSRIPESLDEFKEDCIRRIEFTINDSQIQKVRRFCTKEQYRNEKIAGLTSKHKLTGNQELYELMLNKMMDNNLIRRFDPRILALELVAPIALMIEVVDREPDRIDEMRLQINEYLTHFINMYGNRSGEVIEKKRGR